MMCENSLRNPWVCAVMRWGEDDRVQKALEKLSSVGDFLLNGFDTYSWFLAKLCSEAATIYSTSSLRHYVSELSQKISPTGKTALERYLRQSYQRYKTLAWPSQVTGIMRLIEGQSFVLCTPTGSGKTTVAELAMLQSLFLDQTSDEPANGTLAPLALYLVPSRALAAEVESNLSRVLRNLNNPPINVTGLYGGTDWGPTDAWLTADVQTVLICTYEKAEALIRFLGPLFLRRVTLVVIDEAHSIQFDGNISDLRKAESRSLRLEVLGTRLFSYLDQSKGRVIALSAVASRMQNALANWVTGQANAEPAKTIYRSTRQLIGRLECLSNRNFIIRYDLLDGADLQFEQGPQDETPYIVTPFPACPSAARWENRSANRGPEKRLRPYLLWAAMQLASQYHKSQLGAVLISVTQYINGYAEDFLTLLDSIWADVEKPEFFLSPQEDARKVEIWQKCLRSCEDYFGKESREYQLLEKGIVVHHGKMPGLMARLLIQVVQERIVHIVLATSTLSEGVNLPVETVLIPSLQRRGGSINAREFSNLVGRAGRPGIGTEGRSLVLLENLQGRSSTALDEARRVRRRYFELINELKGQIEVTDRETGALSPLAELLSYLERQWNQYFASSNHTEFLEWLEKVAPLEIKGKLDEDRLSVIEAVDTLDSILLATITELEQVENEALSPSQLEDRLRQIWQRSYAHFAAREEKRLDEIFIHRGQAIKSTIYPEAAQRRRLYRTNLPPRSGNELLSLYPTIIEHLKTGEDYAIWTKEKRFEYIQTVVGLVGSLPKFGLSSKAGRKEVDWQDVLRWWLDPTYGIEPITASEISDWYDYVSQNFGYRFTWGLGSVIALAGDAAHEGILVESTLEDWPLLELPWIAFWLKELMIWGTLDPVAAYLLAKNIKTTRKDAEEAAALYYTEQYHPITDELLNAATIRNWADAQFRQAQIGSSKRPPEHIKVELVRDFSKVANDQWRVIPVEVGNDIHWFDPAGFPFAICQKPKGWESNYLNTYDFILNTSYAVVSSHAFL